MPSVEASVGINGESAVGSVGTSVDLALLQADVRRMMMVKMIE